MRGCVGNPWIFQDCRAVWRGEPLPAPPSIEQQRDAIAGHWADVREFYGEIRAPRIMRKFGIKYAEHHPLSTRVRDAFIAVRRVGDVCHVLDRWYDPDANWPPVPRREGHGDLVAAGATS